MSRYLGKGIQTPKARGQSTQSSREVDSDQSVVDEELSLTLYRGGGVRGAWPTNREGYHES